MSYFGLVFMIHGNDLGDDLVEWLDSAEVTLLDFVATVEAVGFSEAVKLVEAAR